MWLPVLRPKIQRNRLQNSFAEYLRSGLVILALAFLPSACRNSAAEPAGNRVTFATALPLFPASADPSAILNGLDQRSAIVRSLSKRFEIVPLARLDEKVLSGSTLILAQPRGLAGDEHVAIDNWVRAGGRALIFTDPELVWPSELPLGDPRRAPPIGLLDPLLSQWGLDLDAPAMNDDGPVHRIMVGKFSVAVAWAGQWRTRSGRCKIESLGLIANCHVGKGQVLLVADADLLDQRLWLATGADNESAILHLVSRVASSGQDQTMVRDGT